LFSFSFSFLNLCYYNRSLVNLLSLTYSILGFLFLILIFGLSKTNCFLTSPSPYFSISYFICYMYFCSSIFLAILQCVTIRLFIYFSDNGPCLDSIAFIIYCFEKPYSRSGFNSVVQDILRKSLYIIIYLSLKDLK
jgi:hypothetical protein